MKSPSKNRLSNNSPEVLAIIPARGGSKDIPRKNIIDVCGMPLIAYSINVALKSHTISRVVVSTDDDEIAEIALSYGAEVPFLRPKDLASDRSNLGNVFRHALNSLAETGYRPDAMVQLFPTHPFRNPRMLNTLVRKVFDGYYMATTVKPVIVYPNQYFTVDKDNSLVPVNITTSMNGLPHDLLFRPYGLINVINKTDFKPYGYYFHKIDDPVCAIDIDTDDDLLQARHAIQNNLFDFDLT